MSLETGEMKIIVPQMISYEAEIVRVLFDTYSRMTRQNKFHSISIVQSHRFNNFAGSFRKISIEVGRTWKKNEHQTENNYQSDWIYVVVAYVSYQLGNTRTSENNIYFYYLLWIKCIKLLK